MGRIRKALKWMCGAVILFAVAYAIFSLVVRPSLDRNWNKDQAVLARAVIDGDRAKISNIRNIEYRSTSDYDVHYYDKTFDLRKLESVWFVV